MSEEMELVLVDGVLSVFDGQGTERWVGKPDGLDVLKAMLSADGLSAYVLGNPPSSAGRVRNVFKLSSHGLILWRGELPTQAGADAFVELRVNDTSGVEAWTWSGYRVSLDTETGNIVAESFTK